MSRIQTTLNAYQEKLHLIKRYLPCRNCHANAPASQLEEHRYRKHGQALSSCPWCLKVIRYTTMEKRNGCRNRHLLECFDRYVEDLDPSSVQSRIPFYARYCVRKQRQPDEAYRWAVSLQYLIPKQIQDVVLMERGWIPTGRINREPSDCYLNLFNGFKLHLQKEKGEKDLRDQKPAGQSIKDLVKDFYWFPPISQQWVLGEVVPYLKMSAKGQRVNYRNVRSLYIAAKKYRDAELEEECSSFMMKNMSVENFCNFFTIAMHYNEKELHRKAMRLFCAKPLKIIDTAEWQTFYQEQPEVAKKIYEEGLEAIMKRSKSALT